MAEENDPGGSMLDRIGPDGSLPDGSVPDGSVPEGNLPQGDLPQAKAPEAGAPGGITHDEAGRVRLGAAASTPAEILLKLALDPSITVRTALVLNPAAPPAALGLLARDADERVRALLAGKLAALAPRLTATERARLNRQTVEALGCLIEDTAVRVRAAIAEVVKEMPNVPRELVLRLARDTEMEVAGPVIRLSPLLTQADLLSLLAASGAPEVALAIARRPDLTADVAHAVAETADSAAIRAMLLNHSAQIREATLDALIARAAEQVAWHAPLVRRPNLSARAADALSHIVADTLLAELASRADLAPSVAAELRTRLTARLQHAAAPARPDPAPTCAMPTRAIPIGATPTDATPTDAPARSAAAMPGATGARPDSLADAHVRAAAGQLTETDLLGVVGRGEARLAAAMLAVAANVPLAAVERAATLRSAKGVVSLVWRAGFSMKLAVPLQSLLTRLAPSALLAPGPRGSFPLAPEEMRWQLQFLGRGVALAQPGSALVDPG